MRDLSNVELDSASLQAFSTQNWQLCPDSHADPWYFVVVKA